MSDDGRLLPAGVVISSYQLELLDTFGRELRRMNQRINLISSETEQEFWKRHTAHSLALATRPFPADSRITDWGTGGGLPAIPLAILFPDCHIVGVDSVRKKVQSCTAIARRLGLENCMFIHGRAENVNLKTDYSVSRATAPLATLWAWHTRVAAGRSGAENDGSEEARPRENAWPRGLVCLKGGDLADEIQHLREDAVRSGRPDPVIRTRSLSGLFDDPWFEEKVIIHVA